MKNDTALFQFSTDEDMRFELVIAGYTLTGRTLRFDIRERGSNALKLSLTTSPGLTRPSADRVAALVTKAQMAGWARGEYSADLLDVTSGGSTRIVAVRFVYDDPGRLVHGVRGNSATVQWSANQSVVTAMGGVGPAGPANTLGIGTVTTGAAGSAAAATVTGSAPTQTLNLTIPRGNTGTAGAKGDTGDTGPAGPANTLGIGTVTTGAPGSSAAATVTGSARTQTLSLTIPRGNTGATGAKGDTGDTGPTGAAGAKGDTGNTGPIGSGGSVADVLAAAGITIQPSLVVDFVRGDYFASGSGAWPSVAAMVAALGGTSALARTTTATYFDSDGLLKTAAADVSRIGYDPLTRLCRGRVAEASRTNLALRSAEFENATWAKVGANVTAGYSRAPDGTMTMARLAETSANSQHRVTQSASVVSGTTYTFSIFAREPAGNANKRYLILLLQTAEFGANVRICADLATGTFTTTGSPSSVGLVNVGSGIWRVWVAAAATASGSTTIQGYLTNDVSGSFAAYTGDGSSAIEVWGAQFEAAPGPSSYIPTAASTVTRASDILTLATASWMKQGEGTFLIDAEFDVPTNAATWFDANDGTVSNRIYVRTQGGAISPQGIIVSGSVNQSIFTLGGALSNGASYRAAIGYATDSTAMSWGGAVASVDNSVAIPTGLINLGIGGRSSAEPLNGYIRRILYFPQRLSNANLQALSAIVWPSPIASADMISVKASADQAKAEADRAATFVPASVAAAISGLRPSINVSNPTTRLDISPGKARDATNTIDIVLAAGMTKRLDQNWAAGNGNGGLDTGTRAGGTHYHIHLIRNPTSGAVDILFSLSATSPVMPSGYTQRRRIHAFPTWSGGDLWPATWNGGWCSYQKTSYAHINLADNSAVALRDVFMPKGVKVLAKLMLFAQNNASGFPAGHVCVSDPDVGVPVLAGDMIPGISKLGRFGQFAAGEVTEWTDANGRLYFVDTGTGSPQISVYPKGFFDARDEYF